MSEVPLVRIEEELTLGQVWAKDGVYPEYLQKADLDRDTPIVLYDHGTWVCSLCYCVTLGTVEKCYSFGRRGPRACNGNVFQTNAGYVREPECLTKRRSQAALDETRSKNKKLRRRMDNAASAVRAEAAVGATWTCWGWLRRENRHCRAENLMVRNTCYNCSTPILPWDWSAAAMRQGFVWSEHSREQLAMMNRTQGLRGSRGGRDTSAKRRTKRKKNKTKKKRS